MALLKFSHNSDLSNRYRYIVSNAKTAYLKRQITYPVNNAIFYQVLRLNTGKSANSITLYDQRLHSD